MSHSDNVGAGLTDRQTKPNSKTEVKNESQLRGCQVKDTYAVSQFFGLNIFLG